MSLGDILLLTLIGAGVVLAVRSMKKGGGCCGDCSKCSGCRKKQ